VNALFKALNDPTKLGTLVLLEDRDLNAGTIAAHFAISKPSFKITANKRPEK
jgi:DNA-binding transcriptional ArsR family regulator